MSTYAPTLFESALTAGGALVIWQQPALELDAEAPAAAARVVLIGCTKSKRSTSAPAGDLYDTSPLFRGRRSYAVASGHRWAIFSALHGLVTPDTELEPYDVAMTDHGPVTAYNRAVRVIQDAYRLAGISASVKPGAAHATYDAELVLEVHAGAAYVKPLEEAAARFPTLTIEHPVAGMQIGEQLRHYKTLEVPA